MADWNEVGVRAFNVYFNTIRETDDYDESLGAFDGEIIDRMEEQGIDFEEGWEFDMPSDVISSVLSGVIKQSQENSDRATNIAPLHTHIIDKLFEAKDSHGEEQFNEWNKSLEVLLG